MIMANLWHKNIHVNSLSFPRKLHHGYAIQLDVPNDNLPLDLIMAFRTISAAVTLQTINASSVSKNLF